MSRSKRDILETEKMLERLTHMLIEHAPPGIAAPGYGGTQRHDAEALRRISMTLHNWHELECGTDRGAVEREDTGLAYWRFPDGKKVRTVDREAGALKRLKAIMARYPALTAYVQGDPRGCALYILKPGDVPEGEHADAYYSRGLAVFK